MLFKKTTIAVALAVAGLGCSQGAFAQSQEQGWYIGGSVGQMEADGSCPAGFTCDLKDTAWKLFGGYRINRNFAAEAFWGEWGEISVSSGGVTAAVEARTLGVAGLAILPLGQLELFGKLGFGNTKLKAKASAPGVSATAEDDGSELLYGLGAAYNFSRNLAVRAEWERLNDSELDVISIGLQYRF